MKILFAAANPKEQPTLELEKEITRIQMRLARISPSFGPIEFRVFPEVEIEPLYPEMRNFSPDILHVSAHGADGHVLLGSLLISPGQLADILRALPRKPRLVYLNACDMQSACDALQNVIEFTVGSTAPITNAAAIAAASTLYEWLAQGDSVQAAFDAAKAVSNPYQLDGAMISLGCGLGSSAVATRLRELPVIVADFQKRRGARQLTPLANGAYNILYGVHSCPPDTMQAIFFVADDQFLTDDPDATLEDELAEIGRAQPWPKVFWFEDAWETDSEYRVFVSGARARGDSFTLSSTPADALTANLERGGFKDCDPVVLKQIGEIIAGFRGN